MENLLLVLDDVWDPELIHEVLGLCGLSVKILITSQLENLCNEVPVADLMPVMMGEPYGHECMKILAIHAGFQDAIIPRRFLEVAGKITHEAEFNPLVLTTLGSWIKIRNDDIEIWRLVWKDFYGRLRKGHFRPVAVHGVSNPRCISESSKMSVEAVIPDAQILLLLVAMCRTPTTSDAAIHYFYRNINAVLKSRNALLKEEDAPLTEASKIFEYLTLRTQLVDRHLLFLTGGELSIHPVTRELARTMKREIVTKIKDVLCGSSDTVLRTLASLYTDAEFTKKMPAARENTSAVTVAGEITPAGADIASSEITSTTDIPLEVVESSLAELPSPSTDVFAKSIVTRFLMELVIQGPSFDEWTRDLNICVERVLLSFVNQELIFYDGICELLKSLIAFKFVVWFLKNLCTYVDSQSSFWVRNRLQTSGLLPSLLDILNGESFDMDHQLQALDLLSELSGSHPVNAKDVWNCPGMVSRLSLLLEQRSRKDLILRMRSRAVSILSSCAHWARRSDGDHSFMSPSEEASRVLRCLTVMLGDVDLSLRHEACYAIMDLVRMEGRGIRERIVKEQSFLQNLGSALAAHEDPSLIELAAFMCSRLTTSGDPICASIASYPGLQGKLAKALDEPSASTQEHAARALSNLVATSFHTGGESGGGGQPQYLSDLFLFRQHPGGPGPLVQRFTRLVVESDSFEVQEAAVKGLVNLTHLGDDRMKGKLIRSSKLLTRLREFLMHSEKSCLLKENVMCLLSNLTCSQNKAILNKIKIFPGLISLSAQLLVEERGNIEDQNLQTCVTRLLFNISSAEKDTGPCNTGMFPDLLKQLQNRLLQDENLALREQLRESLEDHLLTDKVTQPDSHNLLLIRDFLEALRESATG